MFVNTLILYVILVYYWYYYKLVADRVLWTSTVLSKYMTLDYEIFRPLGDTVCSDQLCVAPLRPGSDVHLPRGHGERRTVLREGKTSLTDQGCLSRILDPTFFHLESRIQGQKDSGSLIRIGIKEFKYFEAKKLFPSYRNYDPGCSFRIRIRIRVKSRIRFRNHIKEKSGSASNKNQNPDPHQCLQANPDPYQKWC